MGSNNQRRHGKLHGKQRRETETNDANARWKEYMRKEKSTYTNARRSVRKKHTKASTW